MNKPADTASDWRAALAGLADRFVDAFNRQSLDDVMSFFANDAVYENSFGDTHKGVAAISAQFAPILDGSLGKIHFGGEDRFIDAEAGKVMDSWLLRIRIGEDGESKLRGLDLLHFDGDKLTRKITYKQDRPAS